MNTAATSVKGGLSTGVKAGLMATGSLAAGWVATTTTAEAADYRRAAPTPVYAPVAFDPWNAWSIGIGAVGTVAVTPTFASTLDYSPVFVSQDTTLASRGVGGTIEIGKDFHALSSPWVFGIYGDLRFGSQTASSSAKGGACCGYNETTTSTMKLRNSASVIGRAGYLLNPGTLVYGLLGFTWQKYEAQQTTSGYYGTGSFSKSGTLGGVTLGFGSEVMLTTNISLKGEYRFTRLGAISTFGGYNDDNYNYMQQSHGKTDLHQVRAVLSLKF